MAEKLTKVEKLGVCALHLHEALQPADPPRRPLTVTPTSGADARELYLRLDKSLLLAHGLVLTSGKLAVPCYMKDGPKEREVSLVLFPA